MKNRRTFLKVTERQVFPDRKPGGGEGGRYIKKER